MNEPSKNAKRALAKKRNNPPTPHPGKATSEESADPLSQNDEAQRQNSVEIGGHPAAIGRSKGRRQSDQG